MYSFFVCVQMLALGFEMGN